MSPKTFTYNQMIQFFIENRLPLSEKQVHLIGTYVRQEFNQLQEQRKNVKERYDREFLKKEKRKFERNQKRLEQVTGS